MSYEELKKALYAYYGDTSRPPEDTREGLEELRDEIETLLDSLR
jgi:hypothetical protein